METIMVEIRSGEGGTDSKLFLEDIKRMYACYCAKKGFEMECL